LCVWERFENLKNVFLGILKNVSESDGANLSNSSVMAKFIFFENQKKTTACSNPEFINWLGQSISGKIDQGKPRTDVRC